MDINITTPSYTTRTFTISDYSAVGGSFAAQDDEGNRNRYKVIGKTLFWEGNVYGQIFNNPSEITIKIPGGYVAAGIGGHVNAIVEGDSIGITIFDSTVISIRKTDGTDWNNSAGTNLYWNLTLEII